MNWAIKIISKNINDQNFSHLMRGLRQRGTTKAFTVIIFIPGMTFIEHDATGFGLFSTSTKHILQFPDTANLSWNQNLGMVTPASWQAWNIVYEASTVIGFPSTNTSKDLYKPEVGLKYLIGINISFLLRVLFLIIQLFSIFIIIL